MENKRDLSISMAQANLAVVFISIPLGVMQLVFFLMIHGVAQLQVRWNLIVLFIIVILSIITHELIHGVAWMIFGHKPLSAIKFGFQWKTFTPYAHLKESVDVNAYRIGGFMPGFILGICPYVLSLPTGSGALFWFGLFHTAAAGGDWLILWLIRHVKAGQQVEDHPANAGCYVLEA
jgi:hypothetical protein